MPDATTAQPLPGKQFFGECGATPVVCDRKNAM
jgi:hypothetical protein